MKRRERPSVEEVIAKVKDDGDFDTLRLKIIRKVKENEDLRNSIVTEVKQSVILNADGSENLKPRQLSDAIYQELGSKIMGQISDEVWKVIRCSESQNDIRGTVETVYKRLVNPEDKKEDETCYSPSKEQPSSSKRDTGPPVTISMPETNLPDTAEPSEPPGFARGDQQASSNNTNHKEQPVKEQSPCLSTKEELHQPPDPSHPTDILPPGFGPVDRGPELQDNASDDDPDLPPGFA